MTTLTRHTGNLFDSTAPALAHGVNVDGLMGAGIAVEFATRFPAMKLRYQLLCRNHALMPGGVFAWLPLNNGDPVVYNLASQDRPGRHARLDWLTTSVTLAVRDAEQRGFDRIAVPQIGCGIGGLDWADVLPELERIAGLTSVDVETWTFTGPS